MEKSFIEPQRRRLEALRAQILEPEEVGMAKEREVREAKGEESQEFEEAAQDMAQNEIHQALHDVDNRRLHAIDQALQKIKQGTYGLSDISGESIPRARLEATPEGVLTVQEEEKIERQPK
ncbi:TraR/DksA family transcriptional regulator [Mesorhizobium sp. M7D.F.Ca.US.005.01.1.1]|jgi:DnaK suppressor protein|uniref:TraR/DksA family transcriptional regulator n=1 Tax=Mesorhizobium sp. M7D.F.Ca.US.005.01.1.1 TaxID=2493678 RepID=UPI000F7503B3|nr:TraR/DksA family transcriptional regulator [Mesorhizobium sp. M7D.F.Ca.US.005.01.1.1]AZO41547.1 TraR/DksA family transcriptional regulator [Mesorhizobium sp. M7D.F.Ca.US.005.01.1.1]